MKAKKIVLRHMYVLKSGHLVLLKEKLKTSLTPSAACGTSYLCDFYSSEGVITRRDVQVSSKSISCTLEHHKRVQAHHARLRAAKERKLKKSDILCKSLQNMIEDLTGSAPSSDFSLHASSDGGWISGTFSTQTIHELLHVLQILQSQAFAYANLMNSQK